MIMVHDKDINRIYELMDRIIEVSQMDADDHKRERLLLRLDAKSVIDRLDMARKGYPFDAAPPTK